METYVDPESNKTMVKKKMYEIIGEMDTDWIFVNF